MERITAAAIWPYWMPDAVMKARAPTVTGCLSAEARISAKMKLFQAKMKARSAAAAMPGPASGTAQRRSEAEGEERGGDGLRAPELVAREGVGRRDAQREGEQHGAGGQDEAVQEVADVVDLQARPSPREGAGEQGGVVAQGWC